MKLDHMLSFENNGKSAGFMVEIDSENLSEDIEGERREKLLAIMF